MSAEPEELTWCCDAPAELRPAFTSGGIGQVKVCTKCGNYARTRRVWDGLPAPGSFEQQEGEKYRPVTDWRPAARRRRR